MLSEKFTLLELTDLALRVPERGAINFNILHTVLCALLQETGLGSLKKPCHIEDETLAQVAVTRARVEEEERGGPRRPRPSEVPTIQQMKQMMRDLEETMDPQQSKQLETDESKELDEAAATAEIPVMEESEDKAADENRFPEREASPSIETVELPEDKSQQEKSGEDITEDLKVRIESGEEVEALAMSELKDTAREILEQKADDLVEKVATKLLEDENILESEPSKVVEEMWRATNINRRMEAAEISLRGLSSLMDVMMDKVADMEDQTSDIVGKTRAMIDEISRYLDRIKALEETCDTLGQRIEDCNTQRAFEVDRLEGMLKDLAKEHEETKSALDVLTASYDDLMQRVVTKADLEELMQRMSEELDTKVNEMKKVMKELEDSLVKKEDFAEIVSTVEDMEELKVNREELGRLLEPGFIDSFLNEQSNLRKDLQELQTIVADLESEIVALKARVEDVLKEMEEKFGEVHAMLDTINAKLALLDPDEINDSFANLEEQAEMIIRELEEMKLAAEQFQKEARINFNKISNVNDLLNRLDQTKADKAKMYELLEMKADLDMLMNKLDRSEFVAIVGDMNDTLERLGFQVKINEEEMVRSFGDVRQDLSLKMYTEDFITATEPLRNRIKAMLYELERVKQMALTHLFPDAPGVVKCFSCKRGAHLAGPKYLGDARVELFQEVPPGTKAKIDSSKFSKDLSDDTSLQEISGVKFPPVDLDSVPVPPPDKPREKDPTRLPLLIAAARPRVGLAHQRRRKDIDEKLSAYFATRPIRACDGEHTKTLPQQRGVTSPSMTVFRKEVLLKGVDKGLYKGAVYPPSDDIPGRYHRRRTAENDSKSANY